MDKILAVRVAMPLDPVAEMGAISNEAPYRKIEEYLEIGKSEGARLLTGGQVPTDPDLKNGLFLTPAVFADAQPQMRIAQEEIYGPVVTVLEWDDYDDMLRVANNVEYGLTAVIVTDDLERAHRTAEALEAGYIEINRPVSYAPGSPYGGWKLSETGREGNIDELLSYTQLKSVNVNFRGSRGHPQRG